MVGTNGHRLVVSALTTEFVSAVEPFRFRASKELAAVMAASSKGADEVEVALGEGMSRFRWQRVTCIIHRDTEDGYPDWRKILPGRSDKAWTVEREALLATGKRMLVLANRASHRVHVSFNGVSGIVETPHEGSGQPHAREVVGGEYKGGDFLLAMNISYLTDLLKRVPEEHVRMWFGTQESAIEIESVRTSDAPLPALSQRFLLMPMRVLG